MDFVDGLNAAELIAQRYPGGMPAELVIKVASAVASALDYAHKQGLLHRDVKPANIMVTHPDDDGDHRILLADFGIARLIDDISGLTVTNMTVATVAYAAPEQLMGEDVDGRAGPICPGSHRVPPANTQPALPTLQARGGDQSAPQRRTAKACRRSRKPSCIRSSLSRRVI